MLNLRNDNDQKSTNTIKRADQTKRWIAWLLCFALLALPSAALAEGEEPTATPSAELTATPEGLPSDAPLTGELAFELPEDEAQYAYRLTDEQVVSRVSLKAEQAFSFSFEPFKQGVLLSWYAAPAEYTVSQADASGASLGETAITDGMFNKYIELDPACTRVTVTLLKEGTIADVSVYGADEELPASVQRWEPTPDKADLLLIAAEPGAEWKPTYRNDALPFQTSSLPCRRGDLSRLRAGVFARGASNVGRHYKALQNHRTFPRQSRAAADRRGR